MAYSLPGPLPLCPQTQLDSVGYPLHWYLLMYSGTLGHVLMRPVQLYVEVDLDREPGDSTWCEREKSECGEKQWHCLLPHQIVFILVNFIYPREEITSKSSNQVKKYLLKNVNIRNQFQIIKESDQNLLVFGGSWSLWSSGREGGTSERGLIDCWLIPRRSTFFFLFGFFVDLQQTLLFIWSEYCHHGFSRAAEVGDILIYSFHTWFPNAWVGVPRLAMIPITPNGPDPQPGSDIGSWALRAGLLEVS